MTVAGYLMRTCRCLDGMEEYGLPDRLMNRFEFGRVPFTRRDPNGIGACPSLIITYESLRLPTLGLSLIYETDGMT